MMVQMAPIEKYLEDAAQRLVERGYGVTRDVAYRGEHFSLVGKRSSWQFALGGYTEAFFVFSQLPCVDPPRFEKFTRECIRYACRSKLVPFKYTPLNPLQCFPVALVDRVAPETAEAIRTRNSPAGFGFYSMPTLLDLSCGELCQSETTPLVGAAYREYFREILRNVVAPGAPDRTVHAGSHTEKGQRLREGEGDSGSAYLERVTQRLGSEGYHIVRNARFRDHGFACVATKTSWQTRFAGFVAHYFIFQELSSMGQTGFLAFTESCVQYARAEGVFALLPFYRSICVPVAIVDGIDAATEEAIRYQDNPMHYRLYEMPVVYDIASRELYHSETVPVPLAIYEGIFSEYFRRHLRALLEP